MLLLLNAINFRTAQMIEANNDNIKREWLAMIETSPSASAAQELVVDVP